MIFLFNKKKRVLPDIRTVLSIIVICAASDAVVERGFSLKNLIMNDLRSSMNIRTLDAIYAYTLYGADLSGEGTDKNCWCMKEKGKWKNWTVNSYELTFDTKFVTIVFKSYVLVYTTYFEYISSLSFFSLLTIYIWRALPLWYKKLIPNFRTSGKHDYCFI